jgi:6-pyruvoyltetrahydropterin/6-carboxytetrahydropterin synthase
MFTISVETYFWASHRLTLPDGSKEPPHSHNWRVAANVSSDRLDGMGLVMDFGRLKAIMDSIVSEFDNSALDRIDYFRRNSSSAENVAKYIYEKLASALPKAVTLDDITVVEEPGCAAKFSG